MAPKKWDAESNRGRGGGLRSRLGKRPMLRKESFLDLRSEFRPTRLTDARVPTIGLTGTDSFLVTGPTTWTGGTISGSGSLTVQGA